jgi:hypothetical protein
LSAVRTGRLCSKEIIIIIIIIIGNENIKHKDSKCRLRQQFDETIDHIISVCPILAKEHYIKRQDRVCAQLHFNICKETGGTIGQKNTGTNMYQNQ